MSDKKFILLLLVCFIFLMWIGFSSSDTESEKINYPACIAGTERQPDGTCLGDASFYED